MNYNKHDDTLSLSPCANQPLPEVNLTDIVRENSVSLGNLYYVVNNLYTHLYGDSNPCNIEDNANPTCLWDEVTNQARTLLLINEKLALICTKLGM